MKKISWLLPLLFAAPLFAQTDAIQGYCDRGGTHSLVSGLPATNWQLGNIPACTVTVYLTGTTTKATNLTADSLGTPLSNPFTATTSTSPNPGYWIFWAPVGQGYDVTMSGGGGVPTCTTQPNCYAIPITKTDLKVGGGGGGTGVTNVSCSDPNPIYGCNVANPGTTPALSFPIKNQAGNTIFGNFNGTSGPPFFAVFTCTGLLTCTYNSGTNTWNVNIPSTSSLSITSTDPIKVNGGNGPVASGTANISVVLPPPGIQMNAGNTPGTRQVIIYPLSHTLTLFPAGSGIATDYATPGGNQTANATLGITTQCGGSESAQVDWSYTGALAAEAPWINPANVTAVTAFAYMSVSTVSSVFNCGVHPYPPMNVGNYTFSNGGATLFAAGIQIPLTYSSASTALSGAAINSATATAVIGTGGANSGTTAVSIPVVGLLVTYTTDPLPPPDNFVRVDAPLAVTTINGYSELFVDPKFPTQIHTYTVAGGLPVAGNSRGFFIAVTDSTDCVTSTGSTIHNTICGVVINPGDVFAWAPVSGAGSSGTYFTEVVSCTTTCTLAHTPTTFDNFSVNGLVMVDGTDFTRSTTTITLSTPAAGGDVYYAQYHY